MGVSVPQPWVKKKTTVAATSSKIVDTIPMSGFSRAEYVVTYRDTTNDKTKSLKMSVETDQAGRVFDQVYARSGDVLDININGLINAGNFELQIVNNESEIITVALARLKL